MNNAQDIFLHLGKSGCYFLSIVRADLKSPTEVVDLYATALRTGIITAECYVNDPVRLHCLAFPTDPVSVVEKSPSLRPAKRYFAHIEGLHFVEVDQYGNIVYNPLTSFRTEGRKVSSYRLLF